MKDSDSRKPIDIGYRSQLIQGAASEYEHELVIEKLKAHQSILLSQISTLEGESKIAIVERERWNARFNTMFMELRELYSRHNKLVEQINDKLQVLQNTDKTDANMTKERSIRSKKDAPPHLE